MSQFDRIVDIAIRKYAKYVEGVAKDALHQAILENVYQHYSPKEYDRTQQLLNSVSSKIDSSGNAWVYIDVSNLNYVSNGGENVSSKVPWWINEGHTQSGFEGISDQYRDYEPRDFLSKAEEIIRVKIGSDVKIEIINNDPR